MQCELTDSQYHLGLQNISHLNVVLLNLLKEDRSEKITIDNKCLSIIKNISTSELEKLANSGSELFLPIRPLEYYLDGALPKIDRSVPAVSRCLSTCQEWALGKHDREIRSLFGFCDQDIAFIRRAGQEDLDQIAFNIEYKLRSRHVFRYVGSSNDRAKKFAWLGVVSA